MPKSEDKTDFMKRWSKAKQKILQQYDLLHELILMSKTSGTDYEFLLDKDPLFIVRNFIGTALDGS